MMFIKYYKVTGLSYSALQQNILHVLSTNHVVLNMLIQNYTLRALL